MAVQLGYAMARTKNDAKVDRAYRGLKRRAFPVVSQASSSARDDRDDE